LRCSGSIEPDDWLAETPNGLTPHAACEYKTARLTS